MAAAVAGLLAVLGIIGYHSWRSPEQRPAQTTTATASRTLTRITFEEGLQTQPTWSPDGRFIAYSSDQSGNFDIWVQPLGSGRPDAATEPQHDDITSVVIKLTEAPRES